MSAAKKIIATLFICLGAWGAPVQGANAAGPVMRLVSMPLPTNFAPGTNGRLFLIADNIGAGPTTDPLTLTDTLPLGLKPSGYEAIDNDPASAKPDCLISGQTVTCTDNGPLSSGRQLEVRIFVEVDPLLPKGTLEDEATLSGGGALTVSTDTSTTIDSNPAPFGFLPPSAGGPDAPLTDPDGLAVTAAGSHPYQFTASLAFPTEEPEKDALISTGHPRELFVDLPRGLTVNPAATPVLCTEAELVTMNTPGCPDASQIGTVTAITFEAASPKAATAPLYNMVPPPGKAAMVAFDPASVGVFIHLAGEVRSEGDFGITSVTPDVLALTLHPVFGARAELWGKPTDPVHDGVRGKCVISETVESCSVAKNKTALLTLPSDCSGKQIETRFRADSWEAPGVFAQGSYVNADLSGAPAFLGGCNELDFKPKIQAQPTTNLTDSPAGLDFNLHNPQNMDFEGRSTANFKDVTLTLPDGLVVNPSAAQGQQACSSEQIGLITGVGKTPIHFSKAPASCPDAAKLGSVEVKTPLLAQVDESKTKILHDANANPIPRPLLGSVYLAKPFDNPFGSLLALYLDVEDPLSGTIAKFAAKVSANPISGQLTNTVIENPELPIEDVRVTTFKGSRAALRTPLACQTYTATAEIVPWSAPQGKAVGETTSFTLGGAPGGGACPTTAAGAPNNPSFVAGTIDPQAGAFSPFVLRVSREDGSQPIAGFEATLPKGLTAKLAGIPYCPETQIAQAQSRNRPEEGRIEQASPSCPAASEVGSVDVAAGAGPTPLHTSGRVYLAGPYKGAPLSFVIITPAIAGPFDLGTVVVRTAAYLNPETAIVRAVSDPLPTILEGIPLDLRSAVVRMGRPQFTLNPTSCEPTQVLATTTSIFGQSAALTARFQAGGCQKLPFKPKISLLLKGTTKRTGHPALRAVAHFRPGDANTERAAVTLPRSEFLDQAHIGTVCTRVQFAAKQCPPRSVYGFAKASTPLLDKGLKGPVYLRSSNHELPDLVVALSGQVEVVLAGRVDSLNGGIRNTFEAAPDAPVGKFVLEMKGGRKGLLQNSENLCAKRSYARVRMRAHNGKVHNFKVLMKNECKRKPGKKGKGGKGKRR